VKVAVLAASFAALLAFSLVSRGAHAAPTRAMPTDSRALELFEQSAQAYREGRFQEAVDRLLEARRFKAEPVLLYNLGRAYEALGKPADAADAYAKYLEEEPEASDRKAIEGRIATLRGQANELAAARRDPAQPRDESDALSAVPWVVMGVGVASLGTGAVLGLVAKGKHDDAVADPVQASAVETQNTADNLARAATVTLIAGAVISAMGLAWLGVRAARPSATSRGGFLQVTF
jgi:tetratricopeptide (TPR) repeat protein